MQVKATIDRSSSKYSFGMATARWGPGQPGTGANGQEDGTILPRAEDRLDGLLRSPI